MYTDYLNKFKNKTFYHVQGSYRERFYKGPELVEIFDKESNKYRIYEMVNFFYTNETAVPRYLKETGQRVFDIKYVKPICGYNDNWLFCLEEDNLKDSLLISEFDQTVKEFLVDYRITKDTSDEEIKKYIKDCLAGCDDDIYYHTSEDEIFDKYIKEIRKTLEVN